MSADTHGCPGARNGLLPPHRFDQHLFFLLDDPLHCLERSGIREPSFILLGKPLFFQPVLFNSRYYRILRRIDLSGRPYMETICEGLSPCVLDKDRTCSFCGACAERKEA